MDGLSATNTMLRQVRSAAKSTALPSIIVSWPLLASTMRLEACSGSLAAVAARALLPGRPRLCVPKTRFGNICDEGRREQVSLPKTQIRAYRWCNPPRIGCAIMSPSRSIGARAGRILSKRKMGSHLVVITGILRKDASKVRFVEHNHMIDALSARRPDQAFNMAVLPRRPKRCRPVPDAHRPDAGLERGAERSVIVPNQVLRCRIPRKRP